MNCLKCGKAVAPSQVFCADCLQTMARFPVESSATVQIPQRNTNPEKSPRRKRSGYADSIRMLRKVIRWLCLALAALTLIICLLSGWLIYLLNQSDSDKDIGKNYTIVETNP